MDLKVKRNKIFGNTSFLLLILFVVSISLQAFSQETLSNARLFFTSQSSSTLFAVEELKLALNTVKIESVEHPFETKLNLPARSYNIVLLDCSNPDHLKIIQQKKIALTSALKKEGFLVHRASKSDRTIWIVGYDESGLMYGGLEVAEIIVCQGIDAVTSQLQNPYFKVRGTKFNIPLDMRTPTYTEPSDAAQKNMDDMWDFEFWKEYIDNLARYRYNLVSLWNMHPFPSMVKVPEYPDVALSDVRRSTGKWKENYSLRGIGFDAPEIMESYEVLKKMSIEEKIAFWQKVMAYGKQRNVNFYLVTWNVFTYGIDGKYGITDKMDNPVTLDYFRKSVKQMLLTYPDLAGIGLTTGENMSDNDATKKEEWAFATYGLGTLDALKEQPNRKIDFIHRQHETKASEITRIFKGITENKNINFLFSFKYAQAHVYSSTKQVFHEGFVKDIQGQNLKTLWTLRNDDVFYFRWGAPDFVREFFKNIPYDISEGYYYGSDQYVWGRDFLTKSSTGRQELELTKHWYQWLCWGRLGYNPDMGNDRFISIINSRFPGVNAQELFKAWQKASLIYPLVTGFHWGALDFQWYIESGQSQPFVAKTPSGYHDVTNFINLRPHRGTENISIPDYVKAFIANQALKGTTPLQLADSILKITDYALNWAENQITPVSREFGYTIDDIKAMSWLGRYYAYKIQAATYVAIYREQCGNEWLTKAHEALNLSAAYWRRYAAIGTSNYHNPLWTNRVGYVDWKKNFSWTTYEITSNGGRVNLLPMQPTKGGVLLEAEDVVTATNVVQNRFPGFTGSGYVVNPHDQPLQQFTWNYNAPATGTYLLEFRYTLNKEDVFNTKLTINGKETGEVQFWNCGNPGSWVWERVTVELKEGTNSISITPDRFVLLDHVNVINIGN